jgi:capsular polysaccharide biosynthesis protein
MAKRIALVRYPPAYFLSFEQALKQVGFEVFWINALRSDSLFLLKHEVPGQNVLDTSAFSPSDYSLEECRARLARLEGPDLPRIHDLVMMDRNLRYVGSELAIKYLGHLERVVTEFLRENRICLVTSWRDSALQLLTMLVCHKVNIPWIAPTRARIPQELYGFCERHDTERLIRFRDVTTDDREWAQSFLKEFTKNAVRPGERRTARQFRDVLRMVPWHIEAFVYELKKSLVDAGTKYARYTIPKLVHMYMRRRVNLAMYSLFPPYRPPMREPYCFFGLHTQPESSIDVIGSYFSDQVALITFIARSIPITHELYVKVHPQDVDGQPLSFYRTISRIPGVRLIDFRVDTRELIRRAAIVFTISGTVGYEAGLMGKAVVTFAKNFFNGLPTIHYCSDPTSLPQLISELLEKRSAMNEVLVLDFLASLKSACFDGEVSRAWKSDKLSTLDLERLKSTYLTIANYWSERRPTI